MLELWRACGLTRPWNDPQKDIARKLRVQPELFLVAVLDDASNGGEDDENGEVVGTAMAGYDGHRGWVNYLAVSPGHQGRGVGRALMAEAETRLRALGCPKLNLQVRAGNAAALGFYGALGYRRDAVVSLGERLERDA